MDGPYIGQYGADLTHTACLYEHGRGWMDVGDILVRHLDRMCWDELADRGSPYRVTLPVIYNVMAASNFGAARGRDPFIQQWWAWHLIP